MVSLLLLHGCAQTTVHLSTYQIHSHIEELRTGETTEVDGHRISLDTTVGVPRRRSSGTREVAIRSLIENCPLTPLVGPARDRAAEHCRLFRVDSVDVGHRINWREARKGWIGGLVALVVVTAFGFIFGLVRGLDHKDSHCDIDCP